MRDHADYARARQAMARAAAVLLAALTIGCADQSPTGPSAHDPSLLTSTTLIWSSSTSSSTTITSTSTTSSSSTTSITTSTTSSGGSGRLSFTMGPYSTATVTLGDHRIYFPAGSICDPAVSTYGPTEWDKPCQTLRSNITITATWWTDAASGHPEMQFEPALRFVPTSDASKWVTLTLKDQYASATSGQSLVIKWQNASGAWIDESLSDATLKTTTDWAHGTVSRRIKHFSGYMVSTRDGSGGAESGAQ